MVCGKRNTVVTWHWEYDFLFLFFIFLTFKGIFCHLHLKFWWCQTCTFFFYVCGYMRSFVCFWCKCMHVCVWLVLLVKNSSKSRVLFTPYFVSWLGSKKWTQVIFFVCFVFGYIYDPMLTEENGNKHTNSRKELKESKPKRTRVELVLCICWINGVSLFYYFHTAVTPGLTNWMAWPAVLIERPQNTA